MNKIEIFAIAMSDLLYTMRIESSFFSGLLTPNTDNLIPEDFKDKIVDDKNHSHVMRLLIKNNIFNDLTECPDTFKNDKGEYEYHPDVYEYSYVVDSYVEQQYEDLHCTKTLWVCPDCGSDNVQFKTWTNANTMKATDDECPMEDSDCHCNDCECTNVLLIKTMIPKRKVIGFQVESVDGIGNNIMHPDMEASFCVYNLKQANEMLSSNNSVEYSELLTIWSDDIEEPTMMFEGDLR